MGDIEHGATSDAEPVDLLKVWTDEDQGEDPEFTAFLGDGITAGEMNPTGKVLGRRNEKVDRKLATAKAGTTAAKEEVIVVTSAKLAAAEQLMTRQVEVEEGADSAPSVDPVPVVAGGEPELADLFDNDDDGEVTIALELAPEDRARIAAGHAQMSEVPLSVAGGEEPPFVLDEIMRAARDKAGQEKEVVVLKVHPELLIIGVVKQKVLYIITKQNKRGNVAQSKLRSILQQTKLFAENEHSPVSARMPSGREVTVTTITYDDSEGITATWERVQQARKND